MSIMAYDLKMIILEKHDCVQISIYTTIIINGYASAIEAVLNLIE